MAKSFCTPNQIFRSTKFIYIFSIFFYYISIIFIGVFLLHNSITYNIDILYYYSGILFDSIEFNIVYLFFICFILSIIIGAGTRSFFIALGIIFLVFFTQFFIFFGLGLLYLGYSYNYEQLFYSFSEKSIFILIICIIGIFIGKSIIKHPTPYDYILYITKM